MSVEAAQASARRHGNLTGILAMLYLTGAIDDAALAKAKKAAKV